MSTNRAEYTIREMTVQDMDAVTALRKQSWLDTYVNPEYGIDEAWIEERFASQATLTTKAERETSFLSGKTRGTFNAWVVVNSSIPTRFPYRVAFCRHTVCRFAAHPLS